MRENPVDEVAGHFDGGLWVVVEGRHDGEDGRASLGGELHVAQVNAIEGRLAHAEDERTALLEAYVGRALDEVRRHSVGNASQSSHGAGKNNHGVGGIATAGDVGCDVGFRVMKNLAGGGWRVEELFHKIVAAAELHLFGEDAQGGFAGDKVDMGDARVSVESAQHLSGKKRAAGSGDGER